jgi:alkanesulfonate monooxygenase SsuD/methylene tetrahydromethanopterin reductase-like flavin-dependent oxidoreductase (luciferase family)
MRVIVGAVTPSVCRTVAAMPCAIFLPIFGELAEPRVVADLAAEAEAAGWDGVFVWDHMLYREPVTDIADPWITLAAVASVTDQVRIGPMVTPLPRRRPQKLARETVSLDRLSGGRLVLGVGLGGDPGGELTAFGEELDQRVRGRMLDEALEVLVDLWSGEPVLHRGEHHVAEGRMRPTAVQEPRIPIWVGARYGNTRPLRRAARYEGLFPVQVDEPDQLAEMLGIVHEHRLTSDPYDVMIARPAGEERDPSAWFDAGATWWAAGFDPFTVDAATVRSVIDAGPPY